MFKIVYFPYFLRLVKFKLDYLTILIGGFIS